MYLIAFLSPMNGLLITTRKLDYHEIKSKLTVSKKMKAINWIATNGAFAALLYAAYGMNIEGAQNIVMLWTWVIIIVSPMFLAKKIQDVITNRGRPIPQIVNVIFDLAVVSTFAWVGAFITAAGYLIHFIILEGVYHHNDHDSHA